MKMASSKCWMKPATKDGS